MPGGLRRGLHREPELLDCLGDPLAAQQSDAQQIEGVGIAWREAQRQPEMPLGVGMPASLEALDAGLQLGARLFVQNFSARWIAGRAPMSFAQRSTLAQPSHSSGSAPLARA